MIKSAMLAELDVESRCGLWLGHARRSSHILIGLKEGLRRAWTIKKTPSATQHGAAFIKGMHGTLGKPNHNKPVAFIPVHINFDATVDLEIDGEVIPFRH